MVSFHQIVDWHLNLSVMKGLLQVCLSHCMVQWILLVCGAEDVFWR